MFHFLCYPVTLADDICTRHGIRGLALLLKLGAAAVGRIRHGVDLALQVGTFMCIRRSIEGF